MRRTIKIPKNLHHLIDKLGQAKHLEYLKQRRRERRNLVLQLRALGMLDTEIAQLLGVRQQAVSQWFRKST